MIILAQGFNTAAKDLSSGSLSQESEALHLSNCALQSSVCLSNLAVYSHTLLKTNKTRSNDNVLLTRHVATPSSATPLKD